MVLIIAYLNDGTILTISKDRAEPSPKPDAWKLKELFSMGFVIGFWLTFSTIAFWVVIIYTSFFEDMGVLQAVKEDSVCTFYNNLDVQSQAQQQFAQEGTTNAGFATGAAAANIYNNMCGTTDTDAIMQCANLLRTQPTPYAKFENQVYNDNNDCLSAYAATAGNNLIGSRTNAIIYLQVSITGQLVIFSTRARLFFFMSRPSYLLMGAFVVAQLIATFIAVYANWPFTAIRPTGWGWAAVAWVWSIVWFLPLDIFKIMTYWILYGNPWQAALENKQAMKLAFNPISQQGRRSAAGGSKMSRAERKSKVLESQKKMGVRMSKKGKA
jgi:hypothetical protein